MIVYLKKLKLFLFDANSHEILMLFAQASCMTSTFEI